MVAVTFSTVWLNLAADLSQYVEIPFVTQIDPQPQTPGEIRLYGRRYRAVTSGGTQRQHALAFQACDPGLVATLCAWDGQVLLYRDDWGEKYYGLYLSPQVKRHSYDVNADVALTFAEVTVSETV